MSIHLPDKRFHSIADIDIQKDIIDYGYKSVLIDVDNTILTRDESIVPDNVKEWLDALQSKGLDICLISNDWHSNVVDLAKQLKLPIVVRAMKPLPFAFIRARNKIGAKRKTTLMIGDQLMTDVFGSHFSGMKVYLVDPLVEQDLKHTLILRKLEYKILGEKKNKK